MRNFSTRKHDVKLGRRCVLSTTSIPLRVHRRVPPVVFKNGRNRHVFFCVCFSQRPVNDWVTRCIHLWYEQSQICHLPPANAESCESTNNVVKLFYHPKKKRRRYPTRPFLPHTPINPLLVLTMYLTREKVKNQREEYLPSVCSPIQFHLSISPH